MGARYYIWLSTLQQRDTGLTGLAMLGVMLAATWIGIDYIPLSLQKRARVLMGVATIALLGVTVLLSRAS